MTFSKYYVAHYSFLKRDFIFEHYSNEYIHQEVIYLGIVNGEQRSDLIRQCLSDLLPNHVYHDEIMNSILSFTPELLL